MRRHRAVGTAVSLVLCPVLAVSLGGGIAGAGPYDDADMPVTPPSSEASESTSSATPTTSSSAPSGSADSSGSSASCSAVELVLINGTSDSSAHHATDRDSGFFTSVASNATRASTSVGRSYVPYDASFGGKPGDSSNSTYEQSVTGGMDNATKMIKDIATDCGDDTYVFVAGYSQGAQVASAVLRDIGSGSGPIDSDRVAGGALLSDPTREAGSDVFPGAPGQSAPAAVPGTDGAAVQQVQVADTAGPEGRGIAPNSSAPDFGTLTGRVASFCVEGDLACDTPTDSPLLQLVVNIAGQTRLDDPVNAISDVAQALGMSALGGIEHVAETVDYDGQNFSMSPTSETALGRMAHYSNPMNHDEALESGLGALSKVAGMGLGAGITILKEVLDPAAIASYAAVGLANPIAAVPLVLARAGNAVVKMLPPATIEQSVNVAFNEIGRTLDENTDVARLAMDTSLWDTITKHGSYDTNAVGVEGETATELVTKWAVAAAEDLGGEVSADQSTGPSTGPGDELLGLVNDVSAAEILDL